MVLIHFAKNVTVRLCFPMLFYLMKTGGQNHKQIKAEEVQVLDPDAAWISTVDLILV